MALPDPVRVPIARDTDIVRARQVGRDVAERLGCSRTVSTLVATAISEVARNIMSYAGHGDIVIGAVTLDSKLAVEVVAEDDGPGIGDVSRALQDGFSTGPGLGLGLPGARRLMDEFEISTSPGAGTTIVMRKWCSP